MGHPEKASSRVSEIVRLHREMNPHRGRPIIVGVDTGTGQLFFCSPSGTCLTRDRAAGARAVELLAFSSPAARELATSGD